MAVFITLSRSEADDAIRKQYGLPSNVDVRIEDDTQSVSDVKSSWINVPSDWEECLPPTCAVDSTEVEVTFRNGSTSSGDTYSWDWSQEGIEYDIIKFRKLA